MYEGCEVSPERLKVCRLLSVVLLRATPESSLIIVLMVNFDERNRTLKEVELCN